MGQIVSIWFPDDRFIVSIFPIMPVGPVIFKLGRHPCNLGVHIFRHTITPRRRKQFPPDLTLFLADLDDPLVEGEPACTANILVLEIWKTLNNLFLHGDLRRCANKNRYCNNSSRIYLCI